MSVQLIVGRHKGLSLPFGAMVPASSLDPAHSSAKPDERRRAEDRTTIGVD